MTQYFRDLFVVLNIDFFDVAAKAIKLQMIWFIYLLIAFFVAPFGLKD